MSVNYTNEQRKAIDTDGSNLLVSAAAGSGKTAVLVERIIRIITNNEKPVDIDRLLVVTFTEAAASEMRQKIQSEILKKLEENPGNINLRRQAMLISKAANISTIHSFCNSVIRDNFFKILIDPSYKIADTGEVFILQREAAEEVFLEQYELSENPYFYDLIEIYGDRFHDERLIELVILIYQFAENSTNPEEWLLQALKKFNLSDDFLVEETAWGKIIKNSILLKLNGALNSCENARKLCNLEGGPVKYIDNLHADKLIIENLIFISDGSFEDMFEAFNNISFTRLSSKKDFEGADVNLKEIVKTIRDDEIKEVIKGIKDRFFFKEAKFLKDDMLNLYPYIEKLCELVINFKRVYFRKKTENSFLDFTDLEQLALKILKDEEVSNHYKEKFYEVFVDEYQDSNLIQEAILSSISKENNRFMVGDIKQSIYKFRRATPEIFIEKYESYGESGKDIKINLSENFRSRKNIINTVNFFFEQIISKEVGDVLYLDEEALHFGAKYFEESEDFSTEVCLIDPKIEHEELDETIEEFKNAELEAKLIAKRVNELINTKSRQIKCSDIAILLRSNKHCDTIISELSKFNISAYSEESLDFFKNPEIMTILSIFKIIDNTLQDIEVLATLYSKTYNFSADDLICLRKYGKNKYFYECLLLALEDENIDFLLKEKINYFNNHLKKWRKQKVYIKITELFDMIVDDTEMFNYLSAENNSEIKKSNLRIFKEICANFTKGNKRSLSEFLRYIEKISEKNGVSGAKIASEADDSVRIMTIHKSKGLEFRFVFVSMLGSNFNKQDERQNIILHPEYGFAPKYIDLELRTKSDTLAHAALAEKIRNENYAEELRVLYVALTRAKEKLILTGCVKNLDKSISKWGNVLISSGKKLPTAYILKATSYLDFLMPALLRHNEAKDILGSFKDYINNTKFYDYGVDFSINLVNALEISNYNYKTNEFFEIPKDDIVFNSELYNKIDKKFKFIYPNKAKTTLPSKILISEVKRNYISQNKFDLEADDLFKFDKIFDLPDFMKEEKPLKSEERGKAMHSVLEHLDVNIHNNLDAIKELVENLNKSNILSDKESKFIPIEKILKFVNSSIGERMKASTEIKKESPFVMEVPASSVFIEDAPKDSKVLIHGIVDCFFKEGNDYVLIDYKTDYVDKNNLNEFIDRYKIQIEIYKNAIEESYKARVKECILYLFYIDDYIIVDIN